MADSFWKQSIKASARSLRWQAENMVVDLNRVGPDAEDRNNLKAALKVIQDALANGGEHATG